MTSVFNRRTALGLLGAGSAAFLAACAPLRNVKKGAESPSESASESPASTASASPTAQKKDYSGEARLEKYDTSAGTYEPGTSEHPPRNMPKPIKPDNMNENSVAGFYSTLAFYAAGLEYAMRSGDTTYMDQVKLEKREKEGFEGKFSQYVSYVAGGLVWYSNVKVVFDLKSSEPNKTSQYYIWPAEMRIDVGTHVYAVNGQSKPVSAKEQKHSMNAVFRGEYIDGVWQIGTLGSLQSS